MRHDTINSNLAANAATSRRLRNNRTINISLWAAQSTLCCGIRHVRQHEVIHARREVGGDVSLARLGSAFVLQFYRHLRCTWWYWRSAAISDGACRT